MPEFNLAAASRQTLRESVVHELRQSIISGALAPGTHLAETDLSAALGVSRGTLREALRHLQEEGLTSQDSRGRVSVKIVTAREVVELFEVRVLLEARALQRLCAMPHREAAVSLLTERLNAMRDFGGSIEEGIDADFFFHQAMFEAADNTVLFETWQNLSSRIKSTMISAGPDATRINMAYDRHSPFVHFVEVGDTEGAERFLKAHMDDAAANLVKGLGEIHPPQLVDQRAD